jgi:hypothetical protein
MFNVWKGAKKFLVATFTDGADTVAFFNMWAMSLLENFYWLWASLKLSPCWLLAFRTLKLSYNNSYLNT